ncbi:DoxX family protein [Saccharothrix sp. NRRL B-16314]|uniref:DoxX family protein n=1 Tax=Saccharothrix sp. NRRL B-16314 TaxID=1463825 RepID=UPI000525BB8F|nr:DoxX family protein [Saccharothrix sp. NRRL B-16314]
MSNRVKERTAVGEQLDRWASPALRVSIGVVFVWFGVLKVIGSSPVGYLVSAAVPWVDPGFLVPALGWFEVALGAVLLIGRLPRLALVAVAVHLAGTFVVFVQAPALVMTEGNPLLLTTSGEFVLKNVVLICAALVLLARVERRRTS